MKMGKASQVLEQRKINDPSPPPSSFSPSSSSVAPMKRETRTSSCDGESFLPSSSSFASPPWIDHRTVHPSSYRTPIIAPCTPRIAVKQSDIQKATKRLP